MDIFTHAIVGGVTGAQFGQPVLGAAIAVIPDLQLFGVRRESPPELYQFLHSVAGVIGVASLLCMLGVSFTLSLACLMSHLAIDVPTHGFKWAPRLLYPFNFKFTCFNEWEFFNVTWFYGLGVSVIWILILQVI